MKAREARELVAKVCSRYMLRPHPRVMYFANRRHQRLIYRRSEDGVDSRTLAVYLYPQAIIILERGASRTDVLHELAHHVAGAWGWETENTLHGKGFHRVFGMLQERFWLW